MSGARRPVRPGRPACRCRGGSARRGRARATSPPGCPRSSASVSARSRRSPSARRLAAAISAGFAAERDRQRAGRPSCSRTTASTPGASSAREHRSRGRRRRASACRHRRRGRSVRRAPREARQRGRRADPRRRPGRGRARDAGRQDRRGVGRGDDEDLGRRAAGRRRWRGRGAAGRRSARPACRARTGSTGRRRGRSPVTASARSSRAHRPPMPRRARGPGT